MKTLKYLAIAAAVLSFMIGCASTGDIQSAKDQSYSGKISDIYVAIDPGADFAEFGKLVKNGFETRLKEAGVGYEVVLLSGIELGVDSTRQDANAHGHKQLLMVQFIEGTVVSQGAFGKAQSTGVYDLSLYDISLDTRIWRAKAKLGMMAWGLAPAADRLVKASVDALTKDGLL